MMREKKTCAVLTFSTTTAAMAMEKACLKQNIPGRLIPVPRQITAGCGLAWRMSAQEYKNYQEELCKLGISFEKIVELLL